MATAKKIDSVGFRISSENKEIIRMAADVTGQDLTSYMISSALEKAKKDILEHQKVEELVLSKRDFEKVLDVIKNPPKANSKLAKPFKSVAE